MEKVFIHGREVTTVGFDVDGILLDLNPAIASFMNNEHGLHLKVEDFVTFRYEEVFKMTAKETQQILGRFIDSPYYLDLKPVEGAVETVRFLASKRINMPVITSRPNRAAALTKANLVRYFGKFFSEIHLSSNPFSGYSNEKESKGALCKKLGVDLMVEDVPRYALDCIDHEIPVALIKPPYNLEIIVHDLVHNYHDWSQFRKDIVLK